MKKDDKYYSKFTVKFDQHLTQTESGDNKVDTKNPQSIQDEANRIQTRLTNWVYVVSNPVGEKLTKKIGDITKKSDK